MSAVSARLGHEAGDRVASPEETPALDRQTALDAWLQQHTATFKGVVVPPLRTPALPLAPAPLRPGDRVQFTDSRRWWKVRAMSERHVILTSPFNLKRTVLYTIIDWERGVRGPDNCHSVGYETPAEIEDALVRLSQPEGEWNRIEVSHRAHSIRVDIAAVRAREETS